MEDKEMLEFFGGSYDKEDSILAYGKAQGITKTFFYYTAVVGVVVLFKVVTNKVIKELEIKEQRHWDWYLQKTKEQTN